MAKRDPAKPKRKYVRKPKSTLSKEAKKIGWDESTLNAYCRERNLAAANLIFGDPGEKKRRPLVLETMKTTRFNPHRWK